MHSRGDEMRRKYLYRVGLAILPVWSGRYIEIVGEKSSESIADTLINGIFGRVTGDAGSRFCNRDWSGYFPCAVFDFYMETALRLGSALARYIFSQGFQTERSGF